ncbi:hypothetical protein BGP78_02070 [Pseudoalteromonas sp. MSK9-3]|nr:hypothetical protein BGP78_02070 [Pseudoalteromonas sp. MSK9-3]
MPAYWFYFFEWVSLFLLNLPVEKKLWSNITRYLVFPIKYLLLGLGEFFKPASIWAFMAFAFLLIGSIIMKKLEVAPEFSLILMNVCIYLPMVLVLCAVPSTYVNYGVKDVHIQGKSMKRHYKFKTFSR